MSACNCRSQPPCAGPTIQCKSIGASESKPTPCGFFHDSKYWLTKSTTSHSYSSTVIERTPGPGLTCSTTMTLECTTTVTEQYDEACVLTTSYTGTRSRNVSENCGEFIAGTCTATRHSTTGAWSSGCASGTCGTTDAPVYENENEQETTEALIARTIGALPAYPEEWGGSCSAMRDLSPDESSYSVQRFKWRLVHPPSGTCYLKVWIRRKFQPEGGGTPTYTSLTPYIWTGTGNPCLSDPMDSYNSDANQITGTETQELEPTTDGVITIEIMKYSCVEDYEPDISDEENPEPNGFPDPS